MGPSANNPICPECGAINTGHAISCRQCGCRLSRPSPTQRDHAYSRLPFAGSLATLVKFVLIVAVIAGLVGLVYWGTHNIFREVEQASPYPDNPAQTVDDFFAALYQQDYQSCYNLLMPSRKAATVIGKQSRGEGYFPYFQRLRDYLTERAEADFLNSMTIAADGRTVVFAQGITLTVSFEIVRSLDKKSHFALNHVHEFPIDIAPGIGIEGRNRSLNRVIQSLDALDQADDSDNPAEIIRLRPDESPHQRVRRLVQACKNARQLDTRHILLERILSEFPQHPDTRQLLIEIAENEQETPHLRLLAERILPRIRSH